MSAIPTRQRVRATAQPPLRVPTDTIPSVGSALRFEYRAVADLKPSPRQTRKHTRKKLDALKSSRDRLGDLAPIIVSEDDEILDGHARVEIAKADGRQTLPCIIVSNRSVALRTAARLALNRLQETGVEWDTPNLALDFKELLTTHPDLIAATGFKMAEVDGALFRAMASPPAEKPERALPIPVSQLGDLWGVGSHRIICGNARIPNTYVWLLASERVDMCMSDPPVRRQEPRNQLKTWGFHRRLGHV